LEGEKIVALEPRVRTTSFYLSSFCCLALIFLSLNFSVNSSSFVPVSEAETDADKPSIWRRKAKQIETKLALKTEYKA